MQILPPTRAPLIVIEQPKAERQPQVDDSADDASPASALQRSIQNSDEMSAALTQFRNRRNFESKAETVSGDFEKVLEEDVLPKAQQIIAAVKVGDRPVEWLLQIARGLFADDSDLVLVLRELLRRKELPVAARQRLEKMLQTVIEQAPPQRLKAGINCALKARLFGKKLGLGAGIMRETYRSFLEAEDGPVDCYEDWVTLYGHQHRQTVLAFIEAALLTDIDALDPSCSRSEFGELLVRLTQLKHLRSADEAFIKHLLADELIRRYECQEPDLLVFLLGVLRYPDELDQLLSGTFGQSLLLASHAERSAALQLMRQVCLRLPPGLFPDAEALQRLAERFTQLADIAYAHETIERRNASDS